MVYDWSRPIFTVHCYAMGDILVCRTTMCPIVRPSAVFHTRGPVESLKQLHIIANHLVNHLDSTVASSSIKQGVEIRLESPFLVNDVKYRCGMKNLRFSTVTGRFATLTFRPLDVSPPYFIA